jgi:hypothetical protein
MEKAMLSLLLSGAEAQQVLGIRPADLEAITLANRQLSNQSDCSCIVDGALRNSWFQKTTLQKDQIEKMFARFGFVLERVARREALCGLR